MTDLINYLNALKARLGIKSNFQFAVRLGISQAGMDKIMKGVMTPGDETCGRIAELSGDQPAVIIALADMSRAKEGKSKEWRTQIYKAVSTAMLLFLFSLCIPTLSEAATKTVSDSLYIMLNQRSCSYMMSALNTLFLSLAF